MKKILVTGGGGQVAMEYQLSQPIEGWDFYFLDKSELDITKPRMIQSIFSKIQPDVVLNLAAYTNVEKAEKEDVQKAFEINAIGPKNLAMECNLRRIQLIHISTDYVFDGASATAYTENDTENPLNQYGRTKFLGEKWIQEAHDMCYIVRVSWVYGNNSKNFFTTMLNLAQERSEINVVDDQYGSPTSTKEICRAIDIMLDKLTPENVGTYHFCGLGRTSWKDFAAEIFLQTRVAVKLNGVSSAKWPSNLTRPFNSYMSSEKFANTFKYHPAHWKNSLREIVAERKIIPVKVGDKVIVNEQNHLVVSTDWLKGIARIALIDNMNITSEIPFKLLSTL